MTNKQFREYLNKQDKDINYRNGVYKQRTRKYGDYLWFQDREKFNWTKLAHENGEVL